MKKEQELRRQVNIVRRRHVQIITSLAADLSDQDKVESVAVAKTVHQLLSRNTHNAVAVIFGLMQIVDACLIGYLGDRVLQNIEQRLSQIEQNSINPTTKDGKGWLQ